MKKTFCMFPLLALFVIVSLGLTGCGNLPFTGPFTVTSITGYGTVPSATQDGKAATFEGEVECNFVVSQTGTDPNTGEPILEITSYELEGGDFQYTDPGSRTVPGSRFHFEGEITGSPYPGLFEGKTDEGLILYVAMVDVNYLAKYLPPMPPDSGFPTKDILVVMVYRPEDIGADGFPVENTEPVYANQGVLLSGNIQYSNQNSQGNQNQGGNQQ